MGLAPSAKRHFGSSLRITQGSSSTREIRIGASGQAVKRAGIAVEDAVDHRTLDLAVFLQDAQRLDLCRGVGMTVIGADDQIVGAALSQDVVEVVRTLTGDVHVVG